MRLIGLCILLAVCTIPVPAQGDRRVKMQPQNLGAGVNSIYDDILPVISPDGKTLFFCRSNSPENVGGGRQDIWYSELLPDSTWGAAKNIGQPLNNRHNNYMCSITPDGNVAIVGDGYSNPSNIQRSIAISRKTATGWSVPTPITIKNFYNTSRYGEYTLANDGRTILMAIERRDGLGGKDIFISFRENDSVWSAPSNLGMNVNSRGHEATPFLASDNSTLYFASDGRGGYGEFDLFVSRRLDSSWTNWSEPENLGPSINTKGWDLYYTIPASGDFAYYVSYQNSYGAGDIFRVPLPENVRPKPVVLVRGRVLNKKTKQPVEADIFYEILPKGQEAGMARSTPTTGEYQIVLPSGNNYGFRASAEGYLSVNDNIDLQNLKEYTEINRDLYLVPIEQGSTAELKNLFFDVNIAVLRVESYPELNRIAELLTQNPNMRVEIQGHTDDRGSNELNDSLSRNRATNVVNYLVQKTGEEARQRINGKGMGKSKPVASNATEEGRALNRRVEIIIIKK